MVQKVPTKVLKQEVLLYHLENLILDSCLFIQKEKLLLMPLLHLLFLLSSRPKHSLILQPRPILLQHTNMGWVFYQSINPADRQFHHRRQPNSLIHKFVSTHRLTTSSIGIHSLPVILLHLLLC